MRIVKVGVLAPTNKGIPLGVQGENRATQVEFDTRPWFREYPSGTVSAVARRYGDPAPYPLSLDVADGTAVWQVSDTDTAKAGEGAVELTMTSGGVRVRSLTFKTLVTASLTDAPVDDDAWYGWLDKAVVKVDETVQSAQRKMAEVDAEWTDLKADVTAKVEECGEVASQAATDAHHAKVDAQAAAKALESAEGSVAKAEAAATRAEAAATRAEAAAEQAYGYVGQASSAAKSASDAAASVNAVNVIVPKHTGVPPSQEDGIAIGAGAVSKGTGSTAVGNFSYADGAGATAIGSQSRATNEFYTAAVNGATTSRTREFSVGTEERTSYVANVTAPSLDYDASNKKYTDDNDAKTLAESKKYTDANTSNALVGNVSGKLLHVEDAWPGEPLGLTIEGVYKQDGTPSPENPVPIAVIENPTLNATGRNLFDVSEEALTESYRHGAYTINDGAISFNTSNNGGGDYLYFNRVKVDGHRLTFSMKWSGDEVGVDNGAKLLLRLYSEAADIITLPAEKVFSYGISDFPAYNSVYKGYPQRSGYTNPISFEFLESAGVAYAVLGVCASSNTEGVPIKIWDVQLEISDVATSYEPYDGSSLPITLPAEHPYLAALPDGTHDEIVIDKDGNASLVARVFRDTNVTKVSTDFSQGSYYSLVANIKPFATEHADYKHPVLCSALTRRELSSRNEGIYRTWTGIYVTDLSGRTKEQVQADIDKAAPLTVYAVAPAVTYPLGKVTVPSLPETISNVWTDAEPTTDMSMTYKRDINIAFDNLVQAVVAAAAGE